MSVRNFNENATHALQCAGMAGDGIARRDLTSEGSEYGTSGTTKTLCEMTVITLYCIT
jgi:hypothetical protein